MYKHQKSNTCAVFYSIYFKHSIKLYPGGIRQIEKTGQGRGMENGQSAAILPSVGHLQHITTLKIAADYCQLCQYKLTKTNLTYPNPEE